MDFQAKGIGIHKSDTFLYCPQCHRSMQHGLQACENCGQVINSEQKTSLGNALKQNFLFLLATASSVFAAVLIIVNRFVE